MNFGTPNTILWVACILMQVAILLAMWRRGLWRQAPVFAAYTAFHLVRSLGLSTLHSNYNVYFWAYWGSAAVGMALAVAAVWEIFRRCLSRYSAVRQVVGLLFLGTVAVLLTTAVGVSLAATGPDTSRVVVGVLGLDRSVRIVLVGVLMLLFAMMTLLRLRWPHLAFGTALGFAIVNAVGLALVVFRLEMGEVAASHYALLKPASYSVALMVWSAYVLRTEPATAPAPVSVEQLEKWNQALVQLSRVFTPSLPRKT